LLYRLKKLIIEIRIAVPIEVFPKQDAFRRPSLGTESEIRLDQLSEPAVIPRKPLDHHLRYKMLIAGRCHGWSLTRASPATLEE